MPKQQMVYLLKQENIAMIFRGRQISAGTRGWSDREQICRFCYITIVRINKISSHFKQYI